MLNIVQLCFLMIASVTLLLGVLINCWSDYLPSFILKCYKYGKFSHKDTVPMTIQVPKRWYRHFYVFASILTVLALYIMCSCYFNSNATVPHLIVNFLSFFKTKTGTVSAAASLLAMGLLTIQCLKRFFETHFISVFSDAKMDIGHYFVGLAHYMGSVLAILCEAPGIINSGEIHTLSYKDLQIAHVIFTLIFLWASKNQLQCGKILSDLRKNEKGEVVTGGYKIPFGGYFELVSCPHQFFEVVMYISLWIILWGNESWPYVLLWVIVNQVETSLLSHWWYQETCKGYPKQRKALIPFLL